MRLKDKFKRFLRMFRINKSISIDLGTANVLIYDKQEGKIVLNEPSVLARDLKTGKVLAVGNEAREMLGKTPGNIVAIRPLKDGVIADIDATREMLAYFINKIYGKSMFKPEVMICAPLEVTSVEKKAIFDALDHVRRIYIIEEGRAAIIGSGIDISKPNGYMVVDIGGGSTDIAILSLDEIIVSKSIKVASNKFDEDIVRYIRENHNLLIGDRTAEKIKKEISSAKFSKDPKTMIVKGRKLDTQIPVSLEINSNEILEAIKDSLNDIISSTKEVLEKAPPEIASDILDNGIIMTGGGSLIEKFTELMSENLKVDVKLSSNPLTSVVLGGGKVLENKKLLKTLQMKEK